VVVLDEVENWRDMWVVERRHTLRLAAEALYSYDMSQKGGSERLDGHLPV
jgi:hypothetical protein